MDSPVGAAGRAIVDVSAAGLETGESVGYGGCDADDVAISVLGMRWTTMLRGPMTASVLRRPRLFPTPQVNPSTTGDARSDAKARSTRTRTLRLAEANCEAR